MDGWKEVKHLGKKEWRQKNVQQNRARKNQGEAIHKKRGVFKSIFFG